MNDVQSNTQIARPLNVLVPIIRSDLDLGDRAGEKAARPYHEKAGANLIEAATADNDQGADEFWDWAEETFGRPKKILRACMELAFENNHKEFGNRGFQSLNDLLRQKNKTQSHGPGARGEVHDAIKGVKAVDRERLSAPKMKLVDERALQKKLALELIDIGYRALAAKLHPDKRGGSKEAMRRLNDVRALLKKLVARR